MTTFEFEVNGRRKIVVAQTKQGAYLNLMEAIGDTFGSSGTDTIRLVESYEGRREIAELRVNGRVENDYRYDLSEELGRFATDSTTHRDITQRRAAGTRILVALEKYFAENNLTVVSTKNE